MCRDRTYCTSRGAKKPEEVKFAVETTEMNETVKNKLKDARIAKIKNESKAEQIQRIHTMIDFSKIAETVESVEDGQLWNQEGSLNPRTKSCLEIAARVND